MEFNPFDALGVDAQMMTKGEIRSCWRDAIKLSHPDHRASELLERFPIPDHVHAAKSCLLEALRTESLGTLVQMFREWPRTFFPHDASCPYKAPHLPSGFVRCSVCSMVMGDQSLATHVSAHDQELCPSCRKCFPRETFADHARSAHQVTTCVTCGDWLSDQDMLCHADFHRCPFCETQLAKGSLIHHFEAKHRGERCEECLEPADLASHAQLIRHLQHSLEHKVLACVFCSETLSLYQIGYHLEDDHMCWACEDCDPFAEDFATHLTLHHKAQPCPACCCNIIKTELMAHLRKNHDFQRCAGCSQSGNDMDHLKKHHLWKRCPKCGEMKPKDSIHIHLLIDHDWLKCQHCHHLESTSQLIEDHMSTHRFKQCVACSEIMTEEEFNDHLRSRHEMRDCPFCNVQPLPIHELRTHVSESHRETRKCPQCSELQTEAGLPIHLRERHGWAKCPFCDAEFPTATQLNQHIDGHDPTECTICGTEHPKQDLDVHLIREHGYVAQPPTGSLKRKKMSSNDSTMAKTKADFNAPGRCPDCGEHSENLYAHRRRRHGHLKRNHTTFKKDRVKCVVEGKDHSVGNQHRCKACKAAKQNETC